jgi:hypothetical protein
MSRFFPLEKPLGLLGLMETFIVDEMQLVVGLTLD